MKRLFAVLLLFLATSATTARSDDCPIINRVVTSHVGNCFSGFFEDCNGRVAGFFSFCS